MLHVAEDVLNRGRGSIHLDFIGKISKWEGAFRFL